MHGASFNWRDSIIKPRFQSIVFVQTASYFYSQKEKHTMLRAGWAHFWIFLPSLRLCARMRLGMMNQLKSMRRVRFQKKKRKKEQKIVEAEEMKQNT